MARVHTDQRRPWLPDDPRHGTMTGYAKHSRQSEPLCEPCRKAGSQYRPKNPRKPIGPSDPRHGTIAGYNAERFQNLPHCGPCTKASSTTEMERRNRIFASGHCTRSHEQPAMVMPGRSVCEQHWQEQKQKAAQRAAKRLAAGQCVACGTEPHAPRRKLGPICRAQRDARNAAMAKRKYGLTNHAFEQMWSNQNGRCAICERRLTRTAGGYATDHNHDTGRTRDLLCNNCNTALGMFQDSPELLQVAMDYLNKHANRPQSTAPFRPRRRRPPRA